MPRGLRRALFAAALLGVALIAWYQSQARAASEHLLDFYPLYQGARALLETGDAYELPDPGGGGGVTAVGNAYPLHAVLLLGVPFSWMTPTAAAVSWTAAVGMSWIVAVWWARESPYWFLWIPFLLGLLLQQPAAAVAVAAVFAMGALRRQSPWILAVSVTVLTMKPQMTLLLAGAFVWWGRQWWRQVLGVLVGVALASFLAQPGWLGEWLARVEVRTELVPTIWWAPVFIPIGALMVYRGWREPGVAVASSALGPWPAVGGSYSAAAWPTGASRSQAAALASLGVVSFLAGELSGRAWAVPAVSAAGLLMAVLLMPRPRQRGTG